MLHTGVHYRVDLFLDRGSVVLSEFTPWPMAGKVHCIAPKWHDRCLPHGPPVAQGRPGGRRHSAHAVSAAVVVAHAAPHARDVQSGVPACHEPPTAQWPQVSPPWAPRLAPLVPRCTPPPHQEPEPTVNSLSSALCHVAGRSGRAGRFGLIAVGRGPVSAARGAGRVWRPPVTLGCSQGAGREDSMRRACQIMCQTGTGGENAQPQQRE